MVDSFIRSFTFDPWWCLWGFDGSGAHYRGRNHHGRPCSSNSLVTCGYMTSHVIHRVFVWLNKYYRRTKHVRTSTWVLQILPYVLPASLQISLSLYDLFCAGFHPILPEVCHDSSKGPSIIRRYVLPSSVINVCSTGSLKIKNKFVIKIETRRVRRLV